MADVVAVEHVTVDGVFQGPARPDEDTRDGFTLGGWGARNDPAMQQAYGSAMGKAWSLPVGRVTYEDLYGVWPKMAPNPMSDALDNVQKFVVSTHAVELPWQSSTLLHGPATETVGRLKARHDRTLVIFGSGQLVQSLLAADLMDRFVLLIHPVVLGSGRRLFEHGLPPTTLELASTTATPSGVIIATYRRVPPG